MHNNEPKTTAIRVMLQMNALYCGLIVGLINSCLAVYIIHFPF